MNKRIKKNKMKYILTFVIFISILFFFICNFVLGKKHNDSLVSSNKIETYLISENNSKTNTIDKILESLDENFEFQSISNLSTNNLGLFNSTDIDYKKRYAFNNLEFFYEYDLFNETIFNTINDAHISDSQLINKISEKVLIICDSDFKTYTSDIIFSNISYINYSNSNDTSKGHFNIRDVVSFLIDKDLSKYDSIVFINSYNKRYAEDESIIKDRTKTINYIHNKNSSIKTYFTQFIPLNIQYDGNEFKDIDKKLQDAFGGFIIPIIPILNEAFLSNNNKFYNILSYIEFYVKFVSLKENEFNSENNILSKSEDNNYSNEVYLTFDDGSCEYTIELLNILKTYNVKATFFVTNQHPVYNYLFKEIINNGHSIGAHTYSHNYNIYKSKEAYFSDLYKIESIIKKETGNFTRLIRFPGGSNNSTSKKYNENIMKELVNEVEEMGYVYYDWNVSSGDGANISSEQTLNNAMLGISNPKPKHVVLFHDTKINTVRIIEPFIQFLIGSNHKILPLNEDSFVCHMSFNY